MARRSPESRELQTTEEVITALGGIEAVCALTGVGRSASDLPRSRRTGRPSGYTAVWNWKSGTFPSRFFLLMTFALHQRRLSAPPHLWGMVTPGERKQALSAVIAQQKKRMAA